MTTELETDVAATLREIAANSDNTTGKILKQCQAAAKKGQYHITAHVSIDEYNYLKGNTTDIPPLIEKLRSLGFKIDGPDYTYNVWENRIYLMTVRW